MGGPDFLDLRLDGGDVYICGQTVTGQVIVKTKEELTNIKAVTVTLKGEGDVHWEERVSFTIFRLESNMNPCIFNYIGS